MIDDTTKRDEFIHPGDLSGDTSPIKSRIDCEKMTNLVLKDNPGAYTIQDNSYTCPSTHYKGFLAIDPHKSKDYHFWTLRDPYGTWTHKRGEESVELYDRSGKLITDPSKSNNNYGDFNYSSNCSFFCIQKK